MKNKIVEDADPNNDQFECEECGGVFDIEDSIEVGDMLICPDCDEKKEN